MEFKKAITLMDTGLVGLEKSIDLIGANGWHNAQREFAPIDALCESLLELSETMIMTAICSDQIDEKEKSYIKAGYNKLAEAVNNYFKAPELQGMMMCTYRHQALKEIHAKMTVMRKVFNETNLEGGLALITLDNTYLALISPLSNKISSKLSVTVASFERRDLDKINVPDIENPTDIRSHKDRYVEEAYGVMQPITDHEINIHNDAGVRLRGFMYEASESDLVTASKENRSKYTYLMDSLFDCIRVLSNYNENLRINVRRVYGLGSEEYLSIESSQLKVGEAMKAYLLKSADDLTLIKLLYTAAKAAESVFKTLPEHKEIISSKRRELNDITGKEQYEIDMLFAKNGGFDDELLEKIADYYYTTTRVIMLIAERRNTLCFSPKAI